MEETNIKAILHRSQTPIDIWNCLDAPKYIVAPMVDHSDLAFRMLTRKYGAQLVYTQMFNANSFITSSEYRENNFTTCAGDRPLVVQFAGHDPAVLLKAAKMVENYCDAIDLNLGCPQTIAKRGRYGAFLMEELELLADIVRTLSTGLRIPVFCKSRIYKDYDTTLNLYETLVNAGASLITVHGRTREEKGQLVQESDWKMIKRLKDHFRGRVPVIANGGIETLEDVHRCINYTGVDGVMTSEAILENPAFFSSSVVNVTWNQIDLTEEYLHNCSKYPVWHMKTIRSHLMKMLHRYINRHISLRDLLGNSYTIEDYFHVCQVCRKLIEEERKAIMDTQHGNDMEGVACDYNARCNSWYNRYRLFSNPINDNTIKTTDVVEVSKRDFANQSKISIWDMNTDVTTDQDIAVHDDSTSFGLLDTLFQTS